ncbi:Adaptin N terminal region family protein [Histomonas meleagridis]|uniref:Adaptin N terminal region family protein n=1 Tax=Histomonas meleagridis TaxID=135588 RepID=UPI0035594CD2|nr:Adaptin N terminal region family protein [Histomonas meleagridis]KAH0800694.1 Adaptin N terminal region family protein [Histomonas meleagridis]
MSKLYKRKGELNQLRDQLDGNDPAARKTAAKRVIALMRSGENVQSLFSSMLRCVKSSDLELKKLTYLYFVNYAETEPEEAIMAVNTFIQDSQDLNPLVRALAVRTMCRIKLENVAEHMIIPLKKTLSDPDPYVRKTAVFGVVKLYDIIPESIENANIFPELLNLLHDDNPMVVSNTTAAIFELNEKRTTPIFTLNSDTIGPILNAINSCSEWCQTILFDSLARYVPTSSDDASFLIDRLIPYLKQSNPAVVIGAFKCIFLFMDYEKRPTTELFPQIIPPFIAIVNSDDYEIQYVVLRTLTLFVQKYPNTLSKQIRMFFCKYNDPSYVKMEKLDIIVTICKHRNAQIVLDELSEYCNSVDVKFVRKSIKCIGQIAIKLPQASRRCVDILVSLVSGKADYAIEESVCVVCDLLRKYPGEFESVINTVCKNLDQLKEARAKAAGIWILGEYCSLIDNVDVLLDPYLDTFHDEQPIVQLTILSSLVKVFVHNPDVTRDQLQFVLSEATKPGNIPDVKNRALIYWRVLSADSNLAKDMLDFNKQTIEHSGVNFDDNVLNELIRNMGSASGVLHIVPSDFVKRTRYVPEEEDNFNSDDDISNNRLWHPLRLNDTSIIDLFADYDKYNIYLRIVNKSQNQLKDFAFALNKNILGIAVRGTPSFPAVLEFGDYTEVSIPICIDENQIGNVDKTDLQIAIRTSMGNVFAIDKIPAQVATTIEGNIDQESFKKCFSLSKGQINFVVEDAMIANEQQLNELNVFVVGRNGNKTYVSFAFGQNKVFVGELIQDNQNILVSIKGDQQYLQIIEYSARTLFAQK